MHQEEIQRLSIEKLAELCAEQTLLFERKGTSDGRYCYELIRRAVLGIEGAWEAVDAHYRPLLKRKIMRLCQGDPSDIEDLVQASLLAFHRNVTPERWHKFPDLKHVLGYLYACARSRVFNHQRDQSRRYAQEVEFPASKEKLLSTKKTPEDKLIDDERRKQIWAIVRRNCKHPDDLFLAELIFVYHLKPRQIVERYPCRFPTRNEVYKQKRNLLDRIKRDPESHSML